MYILNQKIVTHKYKTVQNDVMNDKKIYIKKEESPVKKYLCNREIKYDTTICDPIQPRNPPP